MPVRVFLDWSAPLLPALADRLLPREGHGPLRMDALRILVPTRQAGRRLREALAVEWRHRGGTALLSLEVQPPSSLLRPPEHAPLAHDFDWLAVWRDCLRGCSADDLPALLPGERGAMSDRTALEFGARLQGLREELLDAGLDLAAVAERPALASEQARWRDLARLEADYRAALTGRGLVDPVDAKREALAAFRPEPTRRRIILAGVPDPSPLVLRRLRELDTEGAAEIEVWIHAPEAEAESFDEWGVPRACWRERPLGGEASEEAMILESLADPAAVRQRMLELLDTAPAHPDLALGLLDERLMLPLQLALESAGHPLYAPRPQPLADSPQARLLRALHEQRSRNDPFSLRELWRQPALLDTLAPADPEELLREWDRFAAEALPNGAEAVDRAEKPELLDTAWKRLRDWIGRERPRELLSLLEEVSGERELQPSRPRDRYALRQVNALADLLQEAARREARGEAPSADVLLRMLRRVQVDPPRVEGVLTAEGWLELAYHPAPALLLIGMQEGIVPAVNRPDPFLPNSLREDIGLRGDRDWHARDAYLFHSLLCCRRPEQVRIWVLKRDRTGSPLLPSRLLFACGDASLLRRASTLFQEAPPSPPQPAPATGLDLDPGRLPPFAPTRLSVSQVGDYLKCPARFYFRHVLGMRMVDDRALEPDAAMFGTLLHQTLQRMLREEPVSEAAVWDARCAAHLDALLTERFAGTARMSLRVLRHSGLTRLRAAGRVQFGLWEEGWRTHALELRCQRDCCGLSLHGVLDRIDFHPELGFRILDYKTSDTPTPPGKAHLGPPRAGREAQQFELNDKRRQWLQLQLPLYRWLAAEQPDLDPAAPLCTGYFHLPKDPSLTAVEIWEEEEALATEAATCLEHTVDLIRAGVWHPASAPTLYDEFTPLLHHGTDWIPYATPPPL